MTRAVAYVAYSSLVGGLIAYFSRTIASSAFDALVAAIFSCISCGALAFAFQTTARRRRWGFLPEYLLGMLGRTGGPSCVALVCATTLDESARAVVLRIFAFYALTAPLHVWLTLAFARADANGAA